MNTVSGMNFANARRVCKILFGDHLFKIENNQENLSFDIYIKQGVEIRSISKLKKEYPAFRFFSIIINQI